LFSVIVVEIGWPGFRRVKYQSEKSLSTQVQQLKTTTLGALALGLAHNKPGKLKLSVYSLSESLRLSHLGLHLWQPDAAKRAFDAFAEWFGQAGQFGGEGFDFQQIIHRDPCFSRVRVLQVEVAELLILTALGEQHPHEDFGTKQTGLQIESAGAGFPADFPGFRQQAE